MQKSWLSVQSRSDILRTIFVATDDGFAQVVLDKSDAQKCFILSAHEAEDAGEEIERDLDYWYDSVKVLESMPWKVMLRERCGRKVMAIHIFHALFDGNSLPLLLEKVAQHYLGKDPEVVSSDFHEILPFGPLCEAEGAKAFWQKCLASKSVGLLDLPVRHVRNAKKRLKCRDNYNRMFRRFRSDPGWAESYHAGSFPCLLASGPAQAIQHCAYIGCRCVWTKHRYQRCPERYRTNVQHLAMSRRIWFRTMYL